MPTGGSGWRKAGPGSAGPAEAEQRQPRRPPVALKLCPGLRRKAPAATPSGLEPRAEPRSDYSCPAAGLALRLRSVQRSRLRAIEMQHRGPLAVAFAFPCQVAAQQASDGLRRQIAVEVKELRVQGLVPRAETQSQMGRIVLG